MHLTERISSRAQTRFFLVAIVLAFAFPTSALHVFSGMPFSDPIEFAVCVLVVLPFISASLRRYLRWQFSHQSRTLRAVLLLIPVAVLIVKVSLLAAAPSWGFRACYASLSNRLGNAPCERSYAFPFASPRLTRIDRTIDFTGTDWNLPPSSPPFSYAAGEPNTVLRARLRLRPTAPTTTEWNLSFVNSNRFNYYEWQRNKILRDRIPFSAEWLASFDNQEPLTVEATYVGSGTVMIEGQPAVSLPESYARPATTRFVIGRGRPRMVLRYRFDDQFRTGPEAKPGPGAGIVLRRIADDGRTNVLEAVTAPVAWLAGVLADVLLACGLIALALPIVRAVRRALPALAVWTIGVVVVVRYPLMISADRALYLMGIALVLFATTIRRTRWLTAYLMVMLLAGAHTLLAYPRWDSVLIRSSGDDWLTYESFARTILQTWSLEAGEEIFSYQPLFRYFRFVQRMIFGDGDPVVTIISIGVGLFGVLLLASMIARAGRLARLGGVLVGVFGLSLLWAPWVARLLELGLTEYPTWMALPFILGLLFMRRRASHHALGVALLAASFLTRMNQLPGIALILLAFGMRAWDEQWRRRIVWLSVVFVAILVLPLAHNVYYGGEYVWLTKSIDAPQNVLLRPEEVVPAALGGPKADILRSQLTHVLGFPEGLPVDMSAVLYGMQAMWLACVFVAVRQARWFERILHLVPLAYLLPHVVFNVELYYPKNIVVGYLAMAMVSGLQLWFRQRSVSHEGASVPSPTATVPRRRWTLSGA